MSHAATKWAFDQPELNPDMKPAEQVILGVLADCHNPIHGCFPSQSYIQKRTNLSERAIRYNLLALRARRLVNWETVIREDGKRGNHRYMLAFEADFTPAVDAKTEDPPANEDGEPPANFAGGTTGKNLQEPPAKFDENHRQNLPPNLVITESVRGTRESARASPEKENPDARLLAELKQKHPQTAHDSPPAIDAAFWALTHAERIEAHRRHGAWVGAKGKRQALAALSTYLREKRWSLLPAVAVEAMSGKVRIEAFDRAWWCILFDFLAYHRELEPGSPQRQFLDRQISLAHSKLGWVVAPAELARITEEAALMVKEHVDGAGFKAWRKAASDLRGVTLPTPSFVDWVFVPSVTPERWIELASEDA